MVQQQRVRVDNQQEVWVVGASQGFGLELAALKRGARRGAVRWNQAASN